LRQWCRLSADGRSDSEEEEGCEGVGGNEEDEVITDLLRTSVVHWSNSTRIETRIILYFSPLIIPTSRSFDQNCLDGSVVPCGNIEGSTKR